MFELIRLGLRVGWRGVGLRVLLPLALLVLVASVLGSGFSGRQPSSVARDVGLTGLRLVLLVVALLWVQDLFARDIERKTVYFMLAYPVTRTHYLLSRFLSVALLALVALALTGGLLWLCAGHAGGHGAQVPFGAAGYLAGCPGGDGVCPLYCQLVHHQGIQPDTQ